MRTKHLILSLIAFMAIFLASCSEQQPMMGTEVNGTQTFTFSLTTDGQAQTRAAAPVVTGYKLKYFLQVLDADGATMTGSSTNNDTGTFNVSLPVGAAYTCLFWAHYIPESSGDNEFFNTVDLKAVTLLKHLTGADHCQAFSGTASIAADQAAGSNQTVLLKRAVAQVNIKTDTNMEGYSKLTASYTDVPNTFNVQANTVAATGSITTPSAFEVTTFPADAGADGKFTYQSAYFLASADGVGSMLKLEINTYNSVSNTPIQTLTIANVTTKKNYKTNILASFDPANLAHTYNLSFEDWNAKAIIPPSLWDGVIPAANLSYAFGGGDGSSAENAYIIASAADLAQLTANVARTTYAGKYFKQTVDIDLNDHEWTPIGRRSYYQFAGHYNGNGHTISKLRVIRSSGGLFGTVKGNDISLKNIHVSGTVKCDESAGICAYFEGTNSISLSTGDKQAISGCSFTGNIEGGGGSQPVGGICAWAKNAIITSCANYGNITLNKEMTGIGGIVGKFDSGIVAGCYNTGTLNYSNTEYQEFVSMGGIVGDNSSITIKGCYNIGTVDVTNTDISEDVSIRKYVQSSNTSDCFAITATGGTTLASGVTAFGSSWITPSGTWAADESYDGTFSYASDTFSNCKFWKSLGGWNYGNPVYPKLWWED